MATGQETGRSKDGQSRTSGQSRPKEDAERLKQGAAQVAQDAKEEGKARLESGKDAAADRTEELADTVRSVASQLEERAPGLASYAGDLASNMNRLAESLRTRSIDQLAADAQDIARRNPTLFFLGSAAVGVLLARFAKASSQRRHDSGAGYGTGYGADYGTGQGAVSSYGTSAGADSGAGAGMGMDQPGGASAQWDSERMRSGQGPDAARTQSGDLQPPGAAGNPVSGDGGRMGSPPPNITS